MRNDKPIIKIVERLSSFVAEKTNIPELFLESVEGMVGGVYHPTHHPIREAVVNASVIGLCDLKDGVLINAIKDGDPSASQALRILRGRMQAYVNKLCGSSPWPKHEAPSRIFYGVWEAALKYDYDLAQSKGASWVSYAYPWMKKRSLYPDQKPGSGERPYTHFIPSSYGDDSPSILAETYHINSGLYEEPNVGASYDLQQAMKKLPEPLRKMVSMSLIEGFGKNDIVDYYQGQFKLWKVKSLIKQGISQLRESLGSYDKD